jgi:hypothetical protein
MTELPAPYPLVLGIGQPPSSNRWWAFPLLGILVKAIILIPHYVILYVLWSVQFLAQLVIWVWVLFGGHYPDWAWALTAGTVRWTTRVTLFTYGLDDTYPAFSMEAPGDILIERPAESSRFFAIPILGLVARYVLAIPHFIVLYVLSLLVGLSQLVLWAPVIFTGEFPSWGFKLVGGTTLWTMRVYAYLLGLTDRYPPFSLS